MFFIHTTHELEFIYLARFSFYRTNLLFFLLLLFFLASCNNAVDEINLDVDSKIKIVAETKTGNIILDGSVNSVVFDGTNTIYVGGLFNKAGPRTGSGIIVSSDTGDITKSNLPIVNGKVHAVIPDGSSGWYIGGKFTRVASVAVNNLAHILSDGSIDGNFTPNIAGKVLAIALDSSGIYIGGNFGFVDDIRRYSLAKISFSGNLLAWNPTNDTEVSDLTACGSEIFVITNDLKIYQQDGSVGTPSFNIVGEPKSLETLNDNLYIGSDCSFTIGACTGLRSINCSTKIDNWSMDITGTAKIDALAIANDTLYFGGQFTAVDGNARNNLAAVSLSGVLLSWQPTSYFSSIDSLAANSSGIFATGYFPPPTDNKKYVAAFDLDGAPMDWDSGVTSFNNVLAANDTEVYIGGSFSLAKGIARKNIAAFNLDGDLLSWAPDANGEVKAIHILDAVIYAGGKFKTIGTKSRSEIAAIAKNGSVFDSWQADIIGISVNTIKSKGSTLYVGGEFSSVGGKLRNNVVAISIDGTVLDGWDPNVSAAVHTITISDDTFYFGGNFTTVNGSKPRERLAAVDTLGVATDWTPSANKTVYSMVINGSSVYIGGAFTNIDGLSNLRSGLAAIAVGGTLLSWSPNMNGFAYAITIDGTNILVGGKFRDPITNAYSFALEATELGNLSSWSPQIRFDPEAFASINSIVTTNTKIIFGGQFVSVDEKVQRGIAILDRP